MADPVVVPEYITVHLGRPDEPAQNVTVSFTDYIKNVASSEIYPTWPESAIRANILSQISIALNRVYNEYYRSQGYDFDITNSTQFDQAFQPDRDYFSNISEIVDEIFNTYVVVQGTVQPYYTEYCDGINVQCPGLSQWGTVELANQGYTPYEILQYYYGDNLDLRRADTGPNIPSYPGTPIRFGYVGEEVRTLQQQLNRISRNYPLIPRIPDENGVFDRTTENAVKAFQQIFNLTPDGIVGEATWYSIKRIYNAVKRLSELYSEGISITEAQRLFPQSFGVGARGVYVRTIQYFLDFIGFFIDALPRVKIDGVYGEETAGAVRAFQRYFGLPVTGVVDSRTWYEIIDQYTDLLRAFPSGFDEVIQYIYPGYILIEGASGSDVTRLQTFLRRISQSFPSVPSVTVDGKFGPQTRRAVGAVQTLYGLPVSGNVGDQTWNAIVELYTDLVGINRNVPGLYSV